MNRHELRELMSCCRPDLSDLTEEQARTVRAALEQDAQLRAEWQALQLWDAAIAQGLNDVPVPDGLADRLVASARAQASTTDRPTLLPLFSARVVMAVVATAAVVMLAWGLTFVLGDRLQLATVVEQSRSWLSQLDQEAWRSTDLPLTDFPLDPGVRMAGAKVDWQPCTALHDWPGVVYRAQLPPARSSAFLFVIRAPRWQGRTLPPVPPTVPASTTGGLSIGVWKSDGYIYVLVVPGNHYLQAVNTQAVG